MITKLDDLHDLDDLDARAHNAALAVLGVDRADVVSNGSNYVARAGDRVARVATTTALVRPDPRAFAERELAVTRFLASEGVAVAPADDDAGPHVVDGLVVTVWRWVEHDPSVRLTVDEARPLLRALHAALARYTGPLPLLGPALDDAAYAFAAAVRLGAFDNARALGVDVDVASLERALVHTSDEVRMRAAALTSAELQPLHGDAHVKNILVTARGPVWSDFEDCCRGPRAWDLACLHRRSSPQVLAADTDIDDVTRLFLRARHLQAIAWIALFALRFPERNAHVDLAAALRALHGAVDT